MQLASSSASVYMLNHPLHVTNFNRLFPSPSVHFLWEVSWTRLHMTVVVSEVRASNLSKHWSGSPQSLAAL